MKDITDVWFVTKLDIEELAEKIGLSDIDADAENYWEWVTGSLIEFKLDITRTHTVPPEETETRIFLLEEKKQFTQELCDLIEERLKQLNIAPIHFGSWVYKQGNDFELCSVKTVT
jgi:hypothetical protein